VKPTEGEHLTELKPYLTRIRDLEEQVRSLEQEARTDWKLREHLAVRCSQLEQAYARKVADAEHLAGEVVRLKHNAWPDYPARGG